MQEEVAQKKDVFVWLSNAMHVCPHSVFCALGIFLSDTKQYSTVSNLPANLVLRDGTLKLTLVQGLKGNSWTRLEKVAVARLLLKIGSTVLFSHLGSCQKARAPPCVTTALHTLAVLC